MFENNPEVAAVQARFIAEIQKNGITHALEWIGGWYDQVAAANVTHMLNSELGELADNSEARELRVMDHLMSLAKSNSNYSSGAGFNLMNQSRISALSHELDRDYEAPSSSLGRSRRWGKLQDEVRAKTPTQAA